MAINTRCRLLGFFASIFHIVSVAVSADDRVEFNRDIRPILSENCFHCHGPDAARRKGDLRLDSRDEAIAAKAIVPGKPDQSRIIERIMSPEHEQVMPPPESNKILTARDKELLRRWINDGAEYQGHWAFIAPKQPAVPQDANEGVINPIDNFIRLRLRQLNLKPSAEADRATLIRRVSLDLTGIPPTPEEVDAFVRDVSPKAYENLVDRLLASPRYGERMAMQWLDYARYADSNGFQTDSSRQMWRWREWVINAFNRNLPFDQFTIEQLAGDLLPNPALDQIVATGFHRNTRLNGEGGRIAEEWSAETVIDRVETTGQTWMALTIGCCRCHDHKYDPVTQKEFYQLFAFFNSIDESGVLDSEGGNRGGGNSRPVVQIASDEQLVKQASLEAAVKEAEARVAAAKSELPAHQIEWERKLIAQLSGNQSAWSMITPSSVQSQGGAQLTQLDDGSWLASGKNPDHDTYTVTARIASGELTGLRIEALPDSSLPNQSLGRAPNGNFVLTDVEAEVSAPGLAKSQSVSFVKAEADYEQNGYPVSSILSNSRGNGWAIDGNNPEKRLLRKAMFLAASPIKIPEEATLTIRLKHNSKFAEHNIGRFRLAVTGLATAMVKLDGTGIPESIVAILHKGSGKRSPAERNELSKYFRENGDSPFSRATVELAAARKELTEFQSDLPTTMVMKERPQPRDAFVLKRGEYDKPGEKVERSVPKVLPPLPDGVTVNRLALAQWLVSPEHPLTARVWVNRQWERMFGTGLVRTIDNFGVQSEPPSHPELLDWLATEFVRLKWDMKAMLKLMVMSATYRQSSRIDSQLNERDPENRLLARGPRFRLPAELVRDQALAASGLLVEKTGGPSVRPYMPAGVWDETSKYGDLRGYRHDKGDGLYRRTLYTIWKRTAAPPTMLMFDSPSREVCAVKRARTNTPLQALALLNEVTYIEAARVLAERMMKSGGASIADRIRWGFRRVTSRFPDEAELTILAQGYEKHLARYRSDSDAASKLIRQGETPVDGTLDPAELAALTLTANVLLNLDEVVTKE